MTPTPVGMRCPECASQRTRVVRGVGEAGPFASAPATFILIALNAAVFLAEVATGSGGLFVIRGSSLVFDFGLYGPFVSEGELYRLVTGGFLHAGLVHIGFNMFMLYFLGRFLEPAIGTPRFVGVYVAALFGGAFGALLLSPDSLTIGASGAVFGIFGASFLVARARGLDAFASSIGVILLLNLALSFGDSNISLGGHLGGLVAGVACALAILAGERGRLGPRHFPAEMAAMTAVAVVAIAGALAVA